MHSNIKISLIILYSSFVLMSCQAQPQRIEQKSPLGQLIQQFLIGGLSGALTGATFEYVTQDSYYTAFKTPDGHSIMPLILIGVGLSYFIKLCYEEPVENLIPKLCSFIIGLKGGSVGLKKTTTHDWSNWSR